MSTDGSPALESWIGRTESASPTRWPTRAAAGAAGPGVDARPRRRRASMRGDALPPLWHWLYFPPLCRQSRDRPRRPREARRLPAAGGAAAAHVGRRPARVPARRCGSASGHTRLAHRRGGGEGRASGALVFVTVRHEIALRRRGLAIERGAGHRLPRCAERRARAAAAAAGADRELSARAIVPDGAAVPLLGADLQRPPHPLRPPLRHRGGGLPGLIVHGPLIATLLLDLLRRERPSARRPPLCLHRHAAGLRHSPLRGLRPLRRRHRHRPLGARPRWPAGDAGAAGSRSLRGWLGGDDNRPPVDTQFRAHDR